MRKLMLITSLLIALVVSMPITFAAIQNLVYDANGNLLTGDGKYREYDGFNHLVRIRDGNNATGLVLEEYDWHPLEERTLVKHVYENGSWKESIYYPSKDFVRVKNTSGTFDYKYIYQNGQLVAQELVGGQKNFMLNDHKGSVQIVTNESGAKVEETFYSPFGEIISGGATSRFDYEGKEFDSVVGDYDFHARKANLDWGVFTQPDTLLPNVYDPQQLNRYAFERNNPTKNTDPTGHCAWDLCITEAVVIDMMIKLVAAFVVSYVIAETIEGKNSKGSLQSASEAAVSEGSPMLGIYFEIVQPVGGPTDEEWAEMLKRDKMILNPLENDPNLQEQNINPNMNQQNNGALQNSIQPTIQSFNNIMTITQRIETAIKRFEDWKSNGGGSGGGGSGSCGPEGCVEQIGNKWHLIWVEPVDEGGEEDD